MDLIKQLKNWNNQGKWQRIISTVEKIKPAGRDPQMNLILGHAYVRQAHQKDDSLFKKAIKVLLPLKKDFANTFVWAFDLGSAYYYSDQYGNALPYLNHALKLTPPQDFNVAYQDLVSRIYRYFAYPHFNKNFQERISETWAEFVKKDHKFRLAIDKRSADEDNSQTDKECEAILESAFENPIVYLGKNNDRYHLIVIGHDLFQCFQIEYFKQHAPETILKNWDIFVGQPAGFLAKAKGFPKVPPSKVKLSLKKEQGDVYWVDIYFSDSPKKWGEGLENELQELHSIFLNFTGEIIFRKYFQWSANTKDRGEKDIYLSDLPTFLEKLGINMNADSNTQLNHEVKYRKYVNWDKPLFLALRDLRADITSGTTKIMKLLDNYFGGLNIEISDLEATGAMAGFFFYRTDKLISTKDRRRDLKKFRQSFMKQLVEKAGPDKVTILGDATGKEQDYVDVLMYDTETVIEVAAEILNDSPVSLSGFHTFRRYAGVLLFSGADMLKKEGYQTEFGRVYQYIKEPEGDVLLSLISSGDDDQNIMKKLFEASTQTLNID